MIILLLMDQIILHKGTALKSKGHITPEGYFFSCSKSILGQTESLPQISLLLDQDLMKSKLLFTLTEGIGDLGILHRHKCLFLKLNTSPFLNS
jgi:hypothetical protein